MADNKEVGSAADEAAETLETATSAGTTTAAAPTTASNSGDSDDSSDSDGVIVHVSRSTVNDAFRQCAKNNTFSGNGGDRRQLLYASAANADQRACRQ